MEIIEHKAEMRRIVEDARAGGLVVGVVPTMGYFHEGHLELMRRARADCDVVVVTLFVNPTQFGPTEDLAAYPRDLERDKAMAEGAGVDYIFHPTPGRMYPPGFSTFVEVSDLSSVMCGASRPGHFRGVATVVAKLFNIVPAHKAYFGRKDAQQLAVIKRMVADLDLAIEVIGVETVREADGLAMSSRNTYLDEAARSEATVLHQALLAAASLIDEGERDASRIRRAVADEFGRHPSIVLEYTVICDNIFLRPLEVLAGEVLVAVAARVGKARLIDNMVFEIE